MAWSLYQDNQFLKPLVFSNGKSQEDIVEEVLEAIKEGHKVIFIRGVCGTGKSAIALNIAKKLGKTSIIVPGKNLQNQYKKDYERDKYILKNGKKIKISVITGRNNHKCRFLEENNNAIPKFKKEVNSNLYDIFEGIKKGFRSEIKKDISADNRHIPCKIEIKEKNWKEIKQYLKQNGKVDLNKIRSIKDVKRVPIAITCPYWCPVFPKEYELKSIKEEDKKKYLGLNNKEFIFHQRKKGCGFYEQFNSFIEADVIVFNSLKYKLESVLDRKPFTEAEIIDECDEFLDSFSNSRTINLDRLQNSLIYVFGENKVEEILEELNQIIKQIKKDDRILNSLKNKEIIPLKETKIYELLKIIINASELYDTIDDESYLFNIEETARIFENFFDETYLFFHKKEKNLIINLVTTNLAKRFKEIADKNKTIILMSGTLHSPQVLRDVFGLDNFKVIEAEAENQGKIYVKRTGLEKDCKYSNFLNKTVKREHYLKALNKCVEISKKPTLVHINSFKDLPSEQEIKELGLSFLFSQEKIREIQEEDKKGHIIEKFKRGEKDVLFSTKCARGIDFPGEECNSIVFTKYPNPDVRDPFWRILKKTKPQYYWGFYKDKAKRELLQKIYRGLRFKGDYIYLMSPDSRILEAFET
ncbi:MAG: DEAD/DEAH box helicase family protein [Nanoarchaeota archaeon]|nr:DEAD/DEAH box helicase family protein [Nanoarchaeota archaeon]